MIQDSKCYSCKNYLKTTKKYIPTCNAFPKGIPDNIFWGKISHDKPIIGDNGIQFESKEE